MQKPRADARGLLFRMGDPNDRFESRCGVLDLIDKRLLHYGGAHGIKRGRRFYNVKESDARCSLESSAPSSKSTSAQLSP